MRTPTTATGKRVRRGRSDVAPLLGRFELFRGLEPESLEGTAGGR